MPTPVRNEPFKPGWLVRGDKLSIYTEELALTVRAWPHLTAWTCRYGESWSGARPSWPFVIDIDRVLEAGSAERAFEYLRKQVEAGRVLKRPEPGTEPEYLEKLEYGCHARFNAARWFKSGVPDRAWALASQVFDRQWHLLAIFSRVPESYELAESHFQLAYLLSFCWMWNGIQRPYRALPGVLRWKQARIAGWLGFPPTESTLRILAKIPPRHLLWQKLRHLRDALRSGNAPAALRHLPLLNAGLLRILTDPVLVPLAPWSLLEQMTRPDEQAFGARVTADLLADCARMQRLLPEERLRHPRSSYEVTVWHDDLVDRLNERRHHAGSVFPAPPIPGSENIVPLTTPGQLADEGRTMRHCVASYVDDVVEGRCFIYRVLAPERATVSLAPGHHGWRIDEAKGFANKAIRRETWAALEEWLNRPSGMKEVHDA